MAKDLPREFQERVTALKKTYEGAKAPTSQAGKADYLYKLQSAAEATGVKLPEGAMKNYSVAREYVGRIAGSYHLPETEGTGDTGNTDNIATRVQGLHPTKLYVEVGTEIKDLSGTREPQHQVKYQLEREGSGDLKEIDDGLVERKHGETPQQMAERRVKALGLPEGTEVEYKVPKK